MGNINEYTMINSPIKWVGGKSRLRKRIIELLPAHTCYVEPFSGAAWVLFGKPPSPVEVLNDIDQDLVNFFRVVKECPQELIKSFEWELVARAEFERLANLDPNTLNEVQRARRFYYLIMAGWGGELNYPRFQTSINDGGGGNRLIGALKTLENRLKPVHERLRSVIIECLDWRKCIDRYDRSGTLMYLDPPYPENGCNYKHNMRSWAEHHELADRLKKSVCQWIYSSYDTPEVRALFPEHHIIPVQSASGMKTGRKTISGEEAEIDNVGRVPNKEILVVNFPIPQQDIRKSVETAQNLFAQD